jgi:uncharacterized protein YkwD
MRRLRLKRVALAGGVTILAVCAGCSGTSAPTNGWDQPGSGQGSSGGSGSSGAGSGAGSGVGSSGSPSNGVSSSGGSPSNASSSSGSSSGPTGSSGAGSSSGSGGGPDSGTGDAAGRIDASPGTDAGLADGASPDELAWLTPMNQARAAVGEAPLAWDPIAAQVALNYASQCNYAHNANRNSDYTALGGRGGLGENIAAGTPTESIAMAVSSWLAEISSYNHATNTCSSTTPGCGHYTQIVWKATTGVGCAHVTCTTNSPFAGASRWDYSVCDYNPPGNVGTQSPY